MERKFVEKVSSAYPTTVFTSRCPTGINLGNLLNLGEALMQDHFTRIVRDA